MRSPIEIELGLHGDRFRGCRLRGCLVHLVLIFRRPDADEHGATADSIAFRKVAHPAILAAHLFERSDVSGNSECQGNFRIRCYYRREPEAVGTDALAMNGLSLYSLRRLIQRLFRAAADHDER